MTDPKAEAPQPSRQDLQDTDPTQGHQAETQDLHHLGNKEGVKDTQDPRRELRGQSGADLDLRHHGAIDLLLEDTELAPPPPVSDLAHDLVQDLLATEVDQDLPDTTGHPRHTVIALRQGVRLRHLILQGTGLRSRDTRARTLTLFINRLCLEIHFRIGKSCCVYFLPFKF